MARDCIKRIVAKSNGVISSDEARQLLEEVDKAATRRARSGYDKDNAVKEILDDRKKNVEINLKKQQQGIYRNIALKKSVIDRISTFMDDGLNIKKAFQAELVGINKDVKGGRYSVDAVTNSLQNLYAGKLVNTLEKQGVLSVFNSRKLDKEVAKELWDLSSGKKVGVSGNKEAGKIAQAIYDVQEAVRIRLNRAGADIGKVDGFIMNQSHDPFLMKKAGRDEWKREIAPLLDVKRTFDGADDLDEALDSIYETLITGIRLDDPTQIKDQKLFQFTGPSNLAKKLSGKRVLHFKDSDSFLEYNKKYGYSDLNEGVIGGLQYGSKNIALMERYGTNPRAMIDEVVKQVEKTKRKEVAEGPQNYKGAIGTWVDTLIGSTDNAANLRFARISSNIRAFQSLSKLGRATLSSITDIPNKALEYQFQGKNFLTSQVKPFLDLAEGFKSKKQKLEFSSLVGTGVEGYIGNVGARFVTGDTLSGKMSKLQRLFFKMNGLQWWTETHKLSMGKFMSHELGIKRGVQWENLDVDTKRNLRQYDVNKSDWDAIRKGSRKMEDDKYYVFPEDVKGEAAQKLGAYYVDRTNAGVITGTAREKAITTMGYKAGTPAGEAFRFMMQFKQFPVSFINKAWGRAFYAKGKADVPAMVQLMLLSGVYGYIAMTSKDLSLGKKPKDPLNKKTVLASMLQGGGIGIFGDFLFSDYSSYGTSPLETAAGPVFGTAADIIKLGAGAIQGEPKIAQMLRTTKQNIPFNNLFYLGPAVDYLIMYQIQEALNPGYLRRRERSMAKDYNQEYWLRPSDVAR